MSLARSSDARAKGPRRESIKSASIKSVTSSKPALSNTKSTRPSVMPRTLFHSASMSLTMMCWILSERSFSDALCRFCSSSSVMFSNRLRSMAFPHNEEYTISWNILFVSGLAVLCVSDLDNILSIHVAHAPTPRPDARNASFFKLMKGSCSFHSFDISKKCRSRRYK